MLDIYKIRALGREFCQTEGSEHYQGGGIEPLDLMRAKDIIEDFCVGNMIKYATRFKQTRSLADLRKVSDYAQILVGVELAKKKGVVVSSEKQVCDSIPGQQPDSGPITGSILGEKIPITFRCGSGTCASCFDTSCCISRASRLKTRSAEGNESESHGTSD